MKNWKFDIFCLFAILLLIGVCCKQKDTYREPVIKVVHDTIRVFDTIPLEDLKVLNKLIPVLKQREGLRLYPYKLKDKSYIYFGHLILKNETFNNTEQQADTILMQDIIKCYFERQRILRKTLYKDVYNLFISGKIL